MKSLIEYKIEEIAKKLDEILKTVNTLQDSVLRLNAVLETISITKNEKEILYSVTAEISKGLENFKSERQETCNLKDVCTRRVEKVSLKILQAIAKNVEEGLKEVKTQLESAGRYKEACKDEACMKNALDMLKSVEKILGEALVKKQAAILRKELIQNLDISQLGEDIAEKISPVSNPLRIRILKALVKGKKSYAELERITSIRGGHLQFHLRRLIKSGYIAQEERTGKYMLTSGGLKVLNLLCQFHGF
ncbi:MAG: winged helix-turn-helix domain-containing protein [Archaeoglobaceae archaeon]